MTDVPEADKIAVLVEWTTITPVSRSKWNPFTSRSQWEYLAAELRVQGESWQYAWANKLLGVIFSKHRDSWEAYKATARISVLALGGWINYRLAVATPAEKSEALYRAIVEQKGDT